MPSAESPLESRLDYRFRNPALLREALTHASTGEAHNERLEYLGDAVLNLVVAEELFLRFPQAREGVLTEQKARLVSRATVEEVAGRLGIEKELRIGGSLKGRRSMPRSLRGNGLEAILGAIWLDCPTEQAFAQCRQCITQWFDQELAAIGNEPALSPKHALQNHAQAAELGLPRYHLTAEFQTPVTRSFRVEVELDGKRYPGCWGSSKRDAERRAAIEVLRQVAPELLG
ncbi:MAG: putative dsRNA-binding protein [Planctomycetes bacterium]|nr:putative dsRNA-binding protein [Planctomycetota bacterium]